MNIYERNFPVHNREIKSEWLANRELSRSAKPNMDAAVFPVEGGPRNEPFPRHRKVELVRAIGIGLWMFAMGVATFGAAYVGALIAIG